MGGSLGDDVPTWAEAAFIARCARRYADQFVEDEAEPSAARMAVLEAVVLAEDRAARGGAPLTVDSDVSVLGRKFVDHHDIRSIYEALNSYAAAARNTDGEVDSPETARIVTTISLAALALAASFRQVVPEAKKPTVEDAIELALSGEDAPSRDVARDVKTFEESSRGSSSDNHTGVASEVFGPLWPYGRPPTWPTPRLTFRPRARIIRTIGDRLISGPEAAVIELVKNSYDADASTVRITFFPPLWSGQGQILFEDDGHGMRLVDIQEKWMEPATSDKKSRRESPRGRRLLGSKGIGRFAAARLGSSLELVSTAAIDEAGTVFEKTRIEEIDWNLFEQTRYLQDVSFAVQSEITEGPQGTSLRIYRLRDDWTESAIKRLHSELRRLVSPSEESKVADFKIVLDVSRCTHENAGFDGATLLADSAGGADANLKSSYEVKPFPILEACDYAVDGVFDENGTFAGTMTVRVAGDEPRPISMEVPLEDGEEPCGIVLVKLSIFDRETSAIRSTAEKAGFGHLGVREARKLLDSVSGIAIYREGFRVRPYGDAENDWLTLDAKRVQNPSLKIGRNQVAGVVVIDDEEGSSLTERSSREGLEENGSFRRLQSLMLRLLSEVVEPRRRAYRISVGLETKKQAGFRDVLQRAELDWAKPLLEKLPESDRASAQKLISRESERLTVYLKELEERQAQLEAQVTMGLIVGEVMHQGNTPLAFIETEVKRLNKWWPTILDDTAEAREDRAEVPRMLNGMNGSAQSLRTLFNALSPLSGARRGDPRTYSIGKVVDDTVYLFRSKAEAAGLKFIISPEVSSATAKGYPQDLATALTNLIDNAIYWLQHRGVGEPKIEISAADQEGAKVSLFVRDNGHGVPDEFRDQLFDVGFSLRPSGTGLGLSIAREAVFRSGGDLLLAESDIGAKFAITLPRN